MALRASPPSDESRHQPPSPPQSEVTRGYVVRIRNHCRGASPSAGSRARTTSYARSDRCRNRATSGALWRGRRTLGPAPGARIAKGGRIARRIAAAKWACQAIAAVMAVPKHEGKGLGIVLVDERGFPLSMSTRASENCAKGAKSRGAMRRFHPPWRCHRPPDEPAYDVASRAVAAGRAARPITSDNTSERRHL
jgi:transposase